jgi:spermidine/putrescine transport system substrate-binding protein
MKILSCIAAGALALGLATPFAARAEQPTLNLFIWSDYIDPGLLTAFEKQCNCKVVETDYESNQAEGRRRRAVRRGGALQLLRAGAGG